jgi:hypothetical protein
MRIPVELAVPFVAGLFGLIPLMVQLATARAQRKDKTARLNNLRSELEFLERLNTLHAQIGASNEDAQRQVNSVISSAVSKLLDQYSALSEPARPGAAGEQPFEEKPSFVKRMFLLYTPHTSAGWFFHTVFYVVGFIFLAMFLIELAIPDGRVKAALAVGIFFGIPLVLLQRLARRQDRLDTARLQEPDA